MTKYLNLEMDKCYYDKKNCLKIAEDILLSKKITGMTVRQLAAELYAHAFIFYNFPKLPKAIREISVAKRAYESAANGIDLQDDGDTLKRRAAYYIIFNIL